MCLEMTSSQRAYLFYRYVHCQLQSWILGTDPHKCRGMTSLGWTCKVRWDHREMENDKISGELKYHLCFMISCLWRLYSVPVSCQGCNEAQKGFLKYFQLRLLFMKLVYILFCFLKIDSCPMLLEELASETVSSTDHTYVITTLLSELTLQGLYVVINRVRVSEIG